MAKQYKKTIRQYHNITLCGDAELARHLGITRQAVSGMSNKKKRFLLRLGLTYKKALDALAGGDDSNGAKD